MQGEWTKETAGGGDMVGIASLNWRKNPQYLLTVKEELKHVFISLSQPDKDYSIGLFVIEHSGV